MKIAAAAALAALVVSASALAAGPTIHVTPGSVKAGQRVHLSGSAGGCHAGDSVALLSRAFSHQHEFAGVPAVFARVRSGGYYAISALIPRTRKPAHYSISGRCGGGNLGVTAHLHVLSP